MNSNTLPLSKTPVYIQIVGTGIVVCGVCGIITLFFATIISGAPGLERLLVTTLWIVLLALWLLSSLLAATTWPKSSYTLTDDALRVYKKGWLGGGSEQLYRYDTILSADTSSYFHGRYGTIRLTLAHQTEPVVLRDVAQPEVQARRIKEIVAKHSLQPRSF